ncbi:MAG: Fic family protein [Bacteroidales bacterium]|nr:Fic family protein [Bacteroidales bacterium]
MKKIEPAPNWQNKKTLNIVNKQWHLESFQKQIKSINEKYLYWDKVKYHTNETISDPKVLWSAVKLSRIISSKEISFGNYKFKYNLTDFIQKGLHDFDLYIGGNLSSESTIPEDDKKIYLISSIMEEAIASSQIEGAVTTRKQAKEMLRKNAKPKSKSEQMVLNNYITIKHIVEIKHEPIDTAKLLEIHKLISNSTLSDERDSGVFRYDNDIKLVDTTDGKVVHQPPDYKELPELMNALFNFFNNNDESFFIHPIIKACIIHFIIGYIHPFVDGNGRTARALFYWYLLKNGYWLTEYLSISRLIVKSKAQYARSFQYTEIDENDLTYFLDYKIKTMQLAYDDLRIYIQRKIKEKRTALVFNKIKDINERQALIIKWLVEEPNLLFSVKEIETRFTISNQTARTDLTDLVAKGYLELIHINKKTKAYCRSQFFTKKIYSNKS